MKLDIVTKWMRINKDCTKFKVLHNAPYLTRVEWDKPGTGLVVTEIKWDRPAPKSEIEKLRKLSSLAYEARDKFSAALEKAKSRPDWEALCAASGIHPESDVGDWMC